MSYHKQQSFDDALHRLVHSIGRPKQEAQKEELKKLLDDLIVLCGDDTQRWKLFVLALAQKRYHSLSPTAKEMVKTDVSNKRNDGQDLVYGDGERLLFYMAIEHFVHLSIAGAGTSSSTIAVMPTLPPLECAVSAMKDLAHEAGGSRDLCYLLVSLMAARLSQDEKLPLWKTIHNSMSGLVAIGVADWFSGKEGNGRDNFILKGMLQSVAAILDQDLDIVQRSAGPGVPTSDTLPSTMHVFIPHHERGRKRTNKTKQHHEGNQASNASKDGPSNRQVVNSVLEIILWANTRRAQSNPAFTGAFQRLQSLGTSMSPDAAKKQVFTLQTIIRKLRQGLNSYAREHGHLLSDQFGLNPDHLCSRHVNAGKAADLSNLARLASKKGDARILRLIALRNESRPSKITKFGSVSELLSNISYLKKPSTSTGDGAKGDNEIAELERNICLARLQATVQYLRDVAAKQKKRIDSEEDRPVVAVSMENSKSDHVAAAMMAAAFSSWLIPTPGDCSGNYEQQKTDSLLDTEQAAKLFLSGKEHTVNGFDDVVSLLVDIDNGLMVAEAVDTFMDASSGTATTKALLNFMDRNLPDSALMFLVTKGDLCIPKDYMSSSLIARGCSLHVHNLDDLSARLKREGAKSGDITISLAWDTIDDLDLHVFVPGGEEVFYGNKRSKDGLCFLDVDMNAGGSYSKEPVENIFVGDEDKKIEAAHGVYKVVVQNYAYNEKGSSRDRPVPFRVVVHKNGTQERFQGECTGAGKASDVTVCEFDYHGRTVPFPADIDRDNATEEAKSAFNTSNMINLTASIGQTLESLGQLVHVAYQQSQLDTVRTLVNDDSGAEDDDTDMESRDDGVTTSHHDVRMTEADSKTLEITSRDRLYMTLARLPKKFHNIVDAAFDGNDYQNSSGPSLVELCATDLAKRMVVDRIHIRQLKINGYPDDIIEAVKSKMRVVDP